MVICPSMISGEMLLTMIIIRIQRKMTIRRGNPSQDQGQDLAARKSRVVVAAPVQGIFIFVCLVLLNYFLRKSSLKTIIYVKYKAM